MLKKRITANATANLFAQFVNSLIQLGTVPLFLFFWSKERYGEWLILYSIPGYMALADVGIPTVAANEASMLMAAGKVTEARRSIHTACGLMTFVSVILVVLSVVLGFGLPWRSILGLIGLTDREISLSVCLLGVYTALGLFCALSGAIYRATFRAPRGVYVSSLSRLAELLAMILVLLEGGSVVALSVALLGARIATTLFMYVDGSRVAPELRLGLADFSWPELKRTLRPALLYMAFPLGNAFYFQGLTLLAGRLLGPAAVVVFNTCRALTRAIVQLVTIIKYSIMPEFSYLFGQGDLPRARRLNGLAFEVSLVLALGLSGVLLVLGPWIMNLWTHGAVVPDRSLLGLFLISATLNSVWSVLSVLLISTNRHSRTALYYLGASVISLLAGAVLVGPYGIGGIAMAMIICECLMVPYVLHQSCRLMHQSFLGFLSGALILRGTRALFAGSFAARFVKP